MMKEYVYNLATTFADQWWEDVEANIDDTYLVWISDDDSPTAESIFYYRIYNPYLWAEFNTEEVVGPAGVDEWNHVHTITRIPNNPATDNGGDYGIFARIINQGGPKTLFEHYAMAGHHRLSETKFDYSVRLGAADSDHGHAHGVDSHTHPHGG